MTKLTLTNQAGVAVPVLDRPIGAEFLHLNGTAEPLTTVSIPQGVYTSATATVGGAQLGCASLVSSTGGLNFGTFQYGQTPDANVSVTLPAPITISGDVMGLSLDLLVSKSETLSTCDPSAPGLFSYTITPTFSVTPVSFAAPAGSDLKLVGLGGFVRSMTGTAAGLSVTSGDGNVWNISVNGDTTFQGVGGAAALAVGMLIDMDVAIQVDGSLLATRIQGEDLNPVNLTLWNGPVTSVDSILPVLSTAARLEGGYLFANTYQLGGNNFSFGSAVFQTSKQLSNQAALPFTASFTATNMVAGQNVDITTHAASLPVSYPIYLPATTVTLEPQSVDGTVTAVSTEGNFKVYTVSIAPYDLFQQLAVQTGQTTLLHEPGTVVVYADSSTQMLNGDAASVGSLLRFNGLVFNDNGALRMGCAEIRDGVAE